MKKTITVIVLATLMISSLSLAANADNSTYQGTWLRTRGIITKWGTAPVFGFLGVYAAIINKNVTTHEYAHVNALWSPAVARLNCSVAPTDNFTFSYYTAALVELQGIDFNSTSYALNITGLWDVYNITTKITVTPIVNDSSEHWPWSPWNVSITTTEMLTNATGLLQISGSTNKSAWPTPFMGCPFELDINGIEALTGNVWRYVYMPAEMNICDINGTGTVNLLTLVQAAKLYGARPGLGNYNENAFDFDFNCQGYVGISDLATIAANIHP